MGTYTQILYHIVFATHRRLPTLQKSGREELFKYVNGILANKKCMCLAVGGIEDHIHIVTHIHPTVALSDLIKDIKLATTDMIKRQKLFAHFSGWQAGFGAFSHSWKDRDTLVRYAQNQEAHHARSSFMDEYKELLRDHQIQFEDRHLELI